MKQLDEIKEKLESSLCLEMPSANEAYISKNAEIESLCEAEIAVGLEKIRAVFSGADLKIEYYNADGIRITGKIEKAEFIRREK